MEKNRLHLQLTHIIQSRFRHYHHHHRHETVVVAYHQLGVKENGGNSEPSSNSPFAVRQRTKVFFYLGNKHLDMTMSDIKMYIYRRKNEAVGASFACKMRIV